MRTFEEKDAYCMVASGMVWAYEWAQHQGGVEEESTIDELMSVVYNGLLGAGVDEEMVNDVIAIMREKLA